MHKVNVEIRNTKTNDHTTGNIYQEYTLRVNIAISVKVDL